MTYLNLLKMLGLGLSSAALGQAGNWTLAHASTVINRPQSEFTVHNYGTIHIVRSDQVTDTNSTSAAQSATPTVATNTTNDKVTVATNSVPTKATSATNSSASVATETTATNDATNTNASTTTTAEDYQPVVVDHQQVIPQAQPASDSSSVGPAKATDLHSLRAKAQTANLKAVRVTDQAEKHTSINLKQATPAKHLAAVIHNQAILVGDGDNQNVVTVTSRGAQFTNLAARLTSLFAPTTSSTSNSYPTRLNLLYRTVTVNAHGQTIPGDVIGQINLNYAFTPQLAINQLVKQLIPDNYQLIQVPFSLPTAIGLSPLGEVSLGTTIYVVPRTIK